MTRTGPLVLVAEDEPLASMALRVQLEALDYRVLGPARDGDAAVALGVCFPLDVALFDFRMPRRNGLEAAQALFAVAPTPVVLLSGVNASDLPDPIPMPPIFASLTKPVELAELGKALTQAIAAFDRWLQVEPARRLRADELRRERLGIASAVNAIAGDAAPAPVAARLLDQAARENRSVLDVARQALLAED